MCEIKLYFFYLRISDVPYKHHKINAFLLFTRSYLYISCKTRISVSSSLPNTARIFSHESVGREKLQQCDVCFMTEYT
jgi:hypothetical protein